MPLITNPNVREQLRKDLKEEDDSKRTLKEIDIVSAK